MLDAQKFTGSTKVLALAIVALTARLEGLEEELGIEPEEAPDIAPAGEDVDGDAGPSSSETPNPLTDVPFADDDGAELAINKGLTAEHFEGSSPDSTDGFTVNQVRAIAAAVGR